MEKIIIPIFLFFSILFACDQIKRSNLEVVTFNCKYSFDSLGVKNGEFECFYPDGNIWTHGTIIKDSLKIYEYLEYYPNGVLKNYKFFDPTGKLRYLREYNENEEIINDKGSYYSHSMISQPIISLGDSVIFKIYVASPEGVSYKIYGIDSEGRYEMKFQVSEEKYMKERVINGHKKGNFTFPYEIEISDSSIDSMVVIKNELNFEVVD